MDGWKPNVEAIVNAQQAKDQYVKLPRKWHLHAIILLIKLTTFLIFLHQLIPFYFSYETYENCLLSLKKRWKFFLSSTTDSHFSLDWLKTWHLGQSPKYELFYEKCWAMNNFVIYAWGTVVQKFKTLFPNWDKNYVSNRNKKIASGGDGWLLCSTANFNDFKS